MMSLELFLPLVFRAKLLICPQCVVSNPVDHTQWINRHKPSLLQATPTQLSIIAKHINPNSNMRILVGGEQLNITIAKQLLAITQEVYNVYGPSETTIWSTFKKIEDCTNLSIGKPISDTICCVVDSNMEILPPYVTGELIIGGMGVFITSKLN